MNPETNQKVKVVYEYYGCFYHACPCCYDPDEAHPLKCDPYDFKKERMFHGKVHATTGKIQEDILRIGYILVEKWECWFQKEKRLGLKFDRDLS